MYQLDDHVACAVAGITGKADAVYYSTFWQHERTLTSALSSFTLRCPCKHIMKCTALSHLCGMMCLLHICPVQALRGCRSARLCVELKLLLWCADASNLIAADANILINKCRLAAQQYQFAYQEPIPVEQLVRSLCDNKQGYTQFGGLRPFGVSLLYGGW